MAEYYLSNSGNDAASGNSPAEAWQTIAKLNTVTQGAGLNAGDSVFFHRGSVFYETLFVPSQNDGTSGNPITFSAYGTGDRPIISAHKVLTGWTSIGSGLYEITDSNFPDYIQMLQINGINRPKVVDRILRIRYNGTNTTLVSNNLPNFDYSGGEGEVVVEKNPFIIDKCRIVSRSGDTLTITDPNNIVYGTRELYRFQIQNLIETLEEDGDWMYSPSAKKITIYSPSAHPNGRNIRVSFRQNAINTAGNVWNRFEHLCLEGANDEAFRLDTAHNNRIDDVVVRDTGLSGIGLWTSQNTHITNSKVQNSYCTGIQQRNNSFGSLLERNEVIDAYPFFGSGGSGDARGFGIFGGDSDTIIRFNKVVRAGYVGIRFGGNDALVEKNLVDGYCVIKSDGGGVYSYGGTNGQNTYTNRIVRNNIVIGDPSSSHLDATVGFYTDDNQDNVLYEDNIAIHTPDSALYNHNSQEIDHATNIIYNTRYGKLYIHNFPNELIRNNSMSTQEMVLLDQGQTPYCIRTSLTESDIADFGENDNNVFILCSHKEFVVAAWWTVGGKRIFHNYTLAQWRAMGYDVNSEIRFLDLPEWDIVSEGANKFTGSSSFANITNTGIFYDSGTAVREVDSTSKITGTTSLRARVTSESTKTTRVELALTNLGAIEEGKAYVCRFKALALSGHQSLNVYFNLSGWPYTRLTREWHFTVGDTAKQFEFVVDKFIPVENCSMLIDFQSTEGDLYIDDYEFREITEGTPTNYEDHVRYLYNTEESAYNIALPAGYWEDINGNPLSSPVNIPSYGSMLLFASEAPPPAPTYSVILQVSPSGAGTASKSPTGEQEQGEGYTLTATPASGKQFVRWHIGSTTLSTDNPYSGTMSGSNQTIVAEFEDIPAPTYLITLGVDPAGAGTVAKSPVGAQEENTSFTITATPSSGKQFVRWKAIDPETSAYITFSTSNPHTDTQFPLSLEVIAEFEDIPVDTYTVTTAVSPSASGTANQVSTGPYEQGATVQLLASPASGYRFVRWEVAGNPVSTDASYSFTMPSANITVTAIFELITYSVSTTVAPAGAGTVSGAGTYAPGATANLLAVANAGWQFSYWMIGTDVVSTSAAFAYTVTADDVTLLAFFEGTGPTTPPNTYSLSLTATPSVQGTVSGGGAYQQGDMVTVIATPTLVNFGARFLYWTQNDLIVSYDESYTFTMPGEDTILVAHFELSNTSPALPMDLVRDLIRVSFSPDIPEEGIVEMEGLVELENTYGQGDWSQIAGYINPYAYDLGRADFFVDRALLGRMHFHRPDLTQLTPVTTDGIVKRYRIRHRLLVDGVQSGAQQLSPINHAWLAGRPYTFPDVNPWEGKAYLFLTTRPMQRTIYHSELVFLYLLPLELGTYTLEETIHYTNTIIETTTRPLGQHERYRPFYFNYQLPEEPERIAKVVLRISGRDALAESITLIPKPDPRYMRQIFYGNSFGGFDSFVFSGKAESRHLPTAEFIETDLPADHDRQEGTLSSFNELSTVPVTLRTGIIPLAEQEALRDMALRNVVYLVDGAQLRRIVLEATETETSKDGNFLHATEYVGRFAHQNHAIYGRDPRG